MGFNPPQVPAPHLPPEDVSQQLTRRTTADGGDLLEGYVRFRFAADQKNAVAHVAFCPPFDEAPRLQAEQIEGPSATLKFGPSLPHGVRIECTLDQLSGVPQQILFSISAHGDVG